MKQIFEITDKELIDEVLQNASYGTLALCFENKPYSIPINFVYVDDIFYFHGAKKGKKMEMIKQNPQASFSVVEPFSIIPSYFSSKEGLACPATHFFKSICIDGVIEIVNSYDEKVNALQTLMSRLQKEGGFKHLREEVYEKMINITEVYKLNPKEIRAKFKFGQQLPPERFEMIIEHLEKRGDKNDILTAKQMKRFHKENE